MNRCAERAGPDRRWVVWGISVAMACALLAPVPATRTGAEPVSALEYLGQVRLEPGLHVDGTRVGGLSAISYDPGRDQYYVISDDRSFYAPARFYTVRIKLSDNGITAVNPVESRPLPAADGRPYPPTTADVAAPDPEGIAFDAGRDIVYWSSEGERRPPLLADPSVRVMGVDGTHLRDLTIPAQLQMSAQRTGPRRNTTLEGLTVTPGGRLVVAAMEGPGYDDGEPADSDHGALTRVIVFDAASGTPVGQYAYPLEPAGEPGRFNGLSDLVALSESEFLVVERAGGGGGSEGRSVRWAVRLFRAEIADATDVSALTALTGPDAQELRPMRKTLALDLSQVLDLAGEPIDNIEGITLGPRLTDGRRAVLLVSDDNFADTQITQFLLLALRE